MKKQAYVIVVNEPDSDDGTGPYVLPDADYDLVAMQNLMQARMEELVDELAESVPERSYIIMLADDKMSGQVAVESTTPNHLGTTWAEFSIQSIQLPEGI